MNKKMDLGESSQLKNSNKVKSVKIVYNLIILLLPLMVFIACSKNNEVEVGKKETPPMDLSIKSLETTDLDNGCYEICIEVEFGVWDLSKGEIGKLWFEVLPDKNQLDEFMESNSTSYEYDLSDEKYLSNNIDGQSSSDFIQELYLKVDAYNIVETGEVRIHVQTYDTNSEEKHYRSCSVYYDVKDGKLKTSLNPLD